MKIILFCAIVTYFNFAFGLSQFDKRMFTTNSYWTWSYSEYDFEKEEWKPAYLYETYTVVQRSEDNVTIEMASHQQLDKKGEAHHKFIANLQSCLEQGKEFKSFRRWKIEFYTKSLSPDWELLSKNHKGLAFTEKFNCVSDDKKYNIEDVLFAGQSFEVFQFQGPYPRSWYLSQGHLKGVAYQRFPKEYKMELVSYKIPAL